MRVYIPKDWQCDKHRWLMMRHYAQRYPLWKREINDIKLQYRASGESSGGSAPASEVEMKVERMEKLSTNIEIVEKCCRGAVSNKPYLYDCLLQSVTTNTRADDLNAPIGRMQISRYRKSFFFLLDQELESHNII